MEASHLEELDVGVEQVALGDVDSFGTQLVYNGQYPCSDARFSAAGGIGEGALRYGFLQYDAV